MLYSIVKIIARLALPLYCRHIEINKKEFLKHKGPLILAVNHPNSFLDAIILCTLFDGNIYSLARGDAFKNKTAAKILRLFKMFPVYRVSEGVENLEENYTTFKLCKELFKENGIVLIFSEGRCINEWHLRPLKKGTARLAISSWKDDIDVKVLPVAINYSSFSKFGKNDKAALHKAFYVKQPLLKKILLAIPAAVGYIIHAPLFYVVKLLADKLIREAGHDDSKIVAFLFFTYPVFLLLLCMLLFTFTGCWYWFGILLVLPFTAWAFVQLKPQL